MMWLSLSHAGLLYVYFQTRSSQGRKLLNSIFNRDFELSVSSLSCFIISVCPSVALLKATYGENLHSFLVLSRSKSVHF